MNSTVRFIFNENFLLKKKFVSPVNSAWDPHKTPNASENAASGVFKHSLYLINMRKKKFCFCFYNSKQNFFFSSYSRLSSTWIFEELYLYFHIFLFYRHLFIVIWIVNDVIQLTCFKMDW